MYTHTVNRLCTLNTLIKKVSARKQVQNAKWRKCQYFGGKGATEALSTWAHWTWEGRQEAVLFDGYPLRRVCVLVWRACSVVGLAHCTGRMDGRKTIFLSYFLSPWHKYNRYARTSSLVLRSDMQQTHAAPSPQADSSIRRIVELLPDLLFAYLAAPPNRSWRFFRFSSNCKTTNGQSLLVPAPFDSTRADHKRTEGMYHV